MAVISSPTYRWMTHSYRQQSQPHIINFYGKLKENKNLIYGWFNREIVIKKMGHFMLIKSSKISTKINTYESDSIKCY